MQGKGKVSNLGSQPAAYVALGLRASLASTSATLEPVLLTITKMSDEKKAVSQADYIKARIFITSTSIKGAETIMSQIIQRSQIQKAFIKSRARLPTEVLKITTRKTPNGEGSKTWETYEMRVHRRQIDIQSERDDIKRIVAVSLPSDVEMSISVANN